MNVKLFLKTDLKKSISYVHTKKLNPITKASNPYKDWSFPNKDDWTERLANEVEDFIKEIYGEYGSIIFEELKTQVIDGAIEGSFDVTSKGLEKYFGDYSFKFSNDVQEATEGYIENIIDNIIEEGMNEGYSNDDIASMISERVGDQFDDWEESRSEMIARTETIRASNGAADEAYRQSGVVTGKVWLTTEDDLACSDCVALDGTEIELDGDDTFFDPDDYSDGEYPPAHPNCLIDGNVPVYTSKGYKPIRDIKIGELVLTHKGRFRKVTKLIRSKGETGTKVTDIQLLDKRHKYTTLTVTSNHPVMLNGNWQEASKAKVRMQIGLLSNGECKRCRSFILPYHNNYCSQSCGSLDITDRQWSDSEHIKNISEKNSKSMLEQYATGKRDPIKITKNARKISHARMKEDNWLMYPEIRAKMIEANYTPEIRKASSEREYSFMNAKIVKVRNWKLQKARKLYNLSVEGDESYIVKGFVVHNCRCTMTAQVDPEYDLEQYGYEPEVLKLGLSSLFKGGHGSGRVGHATERKE